MNDEHIKDLEADVEDYRKSVKEAEEAIEDAELWHTKEIVRYANAIIRLDNYKKGL